MSAIQHKFIITMKKALKALATAAGMILPLASMAATGITPPPVPDVQLNYSSVTGLIGTIANWIFGILLAVSIIYILFAAYDYLSGDDAKIETAKKRLLSAAVAIGIALLAKGVGSLVASLLSGVSGNGILPS